MNLTAKFSVFIDRLTFELNQPESCLLKAVLRDDMGSICRALETEVTNDQRVLDWDGLNELPYGVYTFEVLGNDTKLRLVKRI